MKIDLKFNFIMRIDSLKPKKALNKAYLKQRPLRSEIESFKSNLKTLLAKVETRESEENKKNHVRDFLLDTYYKGRNEVNTKDRKDLVIHLGKTNESEVGVIIEAKTPESVDMVKVDRLNSKAFHELVLYYFDERQTKGNSELKNLVITNVFEWFIFDANVFDKQIYRNAKIKKLYQTYKSDKKDNPFFYEELRKIVENLDEEIVCTHFDLKDYKTFLENEDLEDDKNLIELYKVLSPSHLLKEPFAEDSNTLNKPFYDELLHIIGLEEVKVKSKSIIRRKEDGNRDQGSLLENAITMLKSKDVLRKVKDVGNYGETTEERYFNVALELCLTWINRILFLKLLESQLVNYHKGNKEYRFLNFQTISEFDELFTLFHQVLARTLEDRNDAIKEKYKRVPYLNSSLFEPSELEDQTITIESLKDSATLDFNRTTILKKYKAEGKTFATLEYLFKFLDAYDFASEGAEDVQEDSRTLINASVLGKVFEKINGYKDGSIFTPGFITMYMCRQAIRLAVVQKFKDKYGWNIEEFADIKNYLADKRSAKDILEFNALVNSLHLCDPAVGSGHFLVSSLNEIITIKYELGILADENGVRLSDYEITIENDELIITDESGDIFEYQINENGKPTDKAQRLQKTLFHEKQTLIENCLFGVDINPNSVKICRLRLWIELLKNAYFKESSGFAELETLPNIDINIKEGNSLISRFALDEDLKKVLKTIKYSIEDYKSFVLGYKETRDREAKREFEAKIRQIKSDFKTQLFFFSPERIKLADLENQLKASEIKQFLFGEDEDEQAKRLKAENALKTKIIKAKDAIKQIEENAIFKNAFEWRFEFPEVLDNEGNFLGFDIVIGNPPYVGIEDIDWDFRRLFEDTYKTATGRFDLYSLFIEKSLQIKKLKGNFAFIIPGKFLNNKQVIYARKIVCESHNVNVLKIDDKVFENAQVNSVVIETQFFDRENGSAKYKAFNFSEKERVLLSETDVQNILDDRQVIFRIEINLVIDDLISKIEKNCVRVKNIADVKDGIVAGVIKDILYINNKIDNHCQKLFFGKHLSKYFLDDTDIWVNYKPEEMMKIEVARKNGKRAGLWMRDRKIFEREKILSRFVAKEIIATYDCENKFYEHTLHSTHIKNDNFFTKYVLSLFNSSLIKFYYQKTNSQGGDIFPQVRISSVENLPIKQITPKEQQPFIKLVDEILEKKRLGQETADLENKIDSMVYRLYDLTDEEIAIVEGT